MSYLLNTISDKQFKVLTCSNFLRDDYVCTTHS